MLHSTRSVLPACFALGSLTTTACYPAFASPNGPTGLVTALQNKYAVTEMTPDRQQVVRPGVVMTMRCAGIYSDPGTGFALDNLYAGPGKVSASAMAKLLYTKSTHILQTGKKVYITKIESKSESKDDMLRFTIVTVDTLEVPGKDEPEHYAASLTAKFKKGALDELSPEEIEQGLESIMSPETAEDSAQAPARTQQIAPPAPQQYAVAPAPQPVAAPAPAAAAPPPTITIGETSTQVLQAMGMPQQMIDLGRRTTFTKT